MARKVKKKRLRGGASVPCVRCGEPTRVLETRRTEEGVTRLRVCTGNTSHQFVTTERVTLR